MTSDISFLIYKYVAVGSYYFCRSHRDPDFTVWLDPGTSKSLAFTSDHFVVYA